MGTREATIIGHNSFVTTPRPWKVMVLDDGGWEIAPKYLRGTLSEQNLGASLHVLRVRDKLELDRCTVTCS